ncbi:MAG: sulfite exporter TauE/SafE family protein, partial [Candidatus Saccharicenans sp.]
FLIRGSLFLIRDILYFSDFYLGKIFCIIHGMSATLIMAIGFLAGIFSGLFGIGGGIVMVPAMVLLAHFPLIKATGTSLAAILLPVGILGVVAYYRAKLIDIRASIAIAVGLVISVVLGAWLAHSLPADVMRRLYAIFCLYVSWTFIQPLKKIHSWKVKRSKRQPNGVIDEADHRTFVIQDGTEKRADGKGEVRGQETEPSAFSEPNPRPAENPEPHFLALVSVGLLAGVMAGMFGIGGGNIIVPLLILLFRYPAKKAIATSLGALLAPVGLPGVIYYYKAGTLDLKIAALLAVGLVLGTVIGAKMNIRTPGEQIKLLYGLFLVFVALRFFFF